MLPPDATVLIVEDDAEFRAFLRKQLGGAIVALGAANGEDGWAQARHERPDLVLSEADLPGLSGRELCRRIKNASFIADIPVLLLASPPVPAVPLADETIVKPFTRQELRRRLSAYLPVAAPPPAPSPHDRAPASWKETVARIVSRRLSDPGFTADELAAAMTLSRRQLTRRMKDAFEHTPAAYIRRRRLERACQRLQNGSPPIAAVARSVGYRSPSAFSQAFRRYAGCTPTDYRRRHGG
jgi:AraC-like DNA-binding protein